MGHDTDQPGVAVSAASIANALATLCCRFGAPEEEATRRGRVRALLHSSRAFAQALDQFTRHAAPRVRGEHCTSNMQPDTDALVQALSDWSMSVNASAEVYRESDGGTRANSARVADDALPAMKS